MATQLDFKELQGLAAEILGVDADQVQLDKSFAKDLAADSLDLVELIAAVEDKYDVELPEDELAKMKVIGDFWTFLEHKTAERLEAYRRWPRSRTPTKLVPTRCRSGLSRPRAGRARSRESARTRPRRCSPTSTSRR